MRVLFAAGRVREVTDVEVVGMDVGDGQIIGTQINFIMANGNKIEFIYSQDVPIEESGQDAIEFVQELYKNGYADFSQQRVEML
ncbi:MULTISPECIES: hypothetical protein [unclassified Butyrivibrio]|uniref:hypothetical protein n=1 Tax=unclassified Butyrivibrio TaxID=2639466 RepID=UPI0004004F81|nr:MULTISPECIES: hypothetical protein [unclassified Butyrivibrio]